MNPVREKITLAAGCIKYGDRYCVSGKQGANIYNKYNY